MRPAADLARELLAQLDALAPGVGLVLDAEGQALIVTAIGAAQAEALDTAARVVALNPVDRARYPHAVAVELDSAANTLRGAGVRLRKGLAAFPGKAGG